MDNCLLALLTLTFASLTTGFYNEPLGIIGGTVIPITAAPYQAQIEINGTFKCSGAIYNSKWIVTPTTCVNEIQQGANCKPLTTNLSVRVGTGRRAAGGGLHQVDCIVSDENKILTLIRARSKFNFATTVASIQFANDSLIVNYGEPLYVIGWGSTEKKNESYYLRYAKVKHDICGSEPLEICAGTNTTAACSGDLGDPLISGGRLHGLFSELDKNCLSKPLSAGKYLAIAHYYDWIVATVDEYGDK